MPEQNTPARAPGNRDWIVAVIIMAVLIVVCAVALGLVWPQVNTPAMGPDNLYHTIPPRVV
jgi:hypothetical protein